MVGCIGVGLRVVLYCRSKTVVSRCTAELCASTADAVNIQYIMHVTVATLQQERSAALQVVIKIVFIDCYADVLTA